MTADSVAIGLATGRFSPLTREHLRVLDLASGSCGQLIIAVLDTPAGDAACSLAVRAGWLRETYPLARVVTAIRPAVVLDDLQAHATAILALSGVARVDALFSTERADLDLAGALGGELGLIEQASDRSIGHIGGGPDVAWDDLASAARPFFARRVLVAGQDEPRQILADLLARRFVTSRTHDMREAWSEIVSLSSGSWRSADFAALAITQRAAEENAARRARQLLICSGDALAIGLDHREHLESPAPEIEALAGVHRYDLVIFARSAKESATSVRHDQRLLTAYRGQGVDPIEVSGDPAAQLALASDLIGSRLALDPPDTGLDWVVQRLARRWRYLELRPHAWRRGLWVASDARSAGDVAMALGLSGESYEGGAAFLGLHPDTLREADWYAAGHTALLAAERRGDYGAVERLDVGPDAAEQRAVMALRAALAAVGSQRLADDLGANQAHIARWLVAPGEMPAGALAGVESYLTPDGA